MRNLVDLIDYARNRRSDAVNQTGTQTFFSSPEAVAHSLLRL